MTGTPAVRAEMTIPESLSAASGAEKLPSITLPELIAIIDDNPDVRMARSRWQASKKEILASWALPDPMFGFDVMGDMTETRVGPQENRVMLSQDVPFPLKLWKKRQAARARAHGLEQTYLAVRRDMLNELKQTYYGLYWVDASIAIIEEVHALLSKFEGAARSRYANRSGAQRDVAKAQAEVSMTLEQLYELRQQRESLAARLNVILNQSVFTPYGRAVRPELSKVGPTLIELINAAARHREEIKGMEAVIKERKHERTLARLQNIPDVRVGFAYTWVGDGTTMAAGDGQDSWMIPLQFNVPLWQNRIIPEIRAAGEKVKEAEAGLEGAVNRVFYEVKDAYFRYEASSKIAVLYETAIVPQAELALKSDQAGYEAGSTDFLNLLDSERMFLNAKLTSVRTYTTALKSLADLERATGMDLGGAA